MKTVKIALLVLLVAVLATMSFAIGQTTAPVSAQAPTPTESISVNLEELFSGIKEAVRQGVAEAIADIQRTATPETVTALATPEPTATARAEATAQAEAPTAAAQVADPFESPFMTNYQDTLEYAVPSELRVSENLLEGFRPVESLVMTDFVFPDGKTQVVLPEVTNDLSPYQWFPQDDPENPLPVWGTPIASYRDGDNWFCDSPDGWCADDIESFNWHVWTGWEVCHPAVGCLKDPNDGAVMLLVVNFHDSDEAWDVRTNTAVYTVGGFSGFGKMWDLSGESYDIGMGVASIRNHYLYNLTSNHDYDGACGSSALCSSITYVVVARVWDRPEIGIKYSHYEILDYGQLSIPAG